MINVTSQYPTQTFLPVGTSNIISQVDSTNSSRIPTFMFPKKYRRLASQTAPDGSGAAMYQTDTLIGPNATYAFQSVKDAQSAAFESNGQAGNEYYIEVSPLPTNCYQILTWTSNL